MKNNIKAIVTDIDGTTTSLSFVQETLLPFAQNRLAEYVFDYEYEVSELLDEVRDQERNPDLTAQEVVEVLLRYIHDGDSIPALSAIQSKIWQQAYEDGMIVGHIYDDAIAGIKRWKDRGLSLYAYSACSVQAQEMLFAHTHIGDITDMFSGYFDLSVGVKDEAKSYTKIAQLIELSPSDVLFLTDSVEDADAASKAGMNTIILDRERALFDAHGHNVVHDFETILNSVSIKV